MTKPPNVRTAAHRDLSREPLAAKVPEITALFWVIKILITGMGEAASDYLGEASADYPLIVDAAGITP